MFGISFEHLMIVGVILLIVGPRRLPELGNTLGKSIKNFKDSFTGIEEANVKRSAEKLVEKTMMGDTKVQDAQTSAPKTATPETQA